MKLLFFIALAVLVEYAGAQCIDPSDPTYANMTFCNSTSCSGSCNSDNGCSCSSDSLLTCVPTPGINCTNSKVPCCPDGLFHNITQSCCSTYPSCDPECATDEVCNSLGECECNISPYRNLTLKNFQPTVKCESDIIIVTVMQCELQALGLDYSTVHLRNSSNDQCTFSYPDSINGQKGMSVQALTVSNWCGNTVTGDDSNVYISNTVYIGILDKPIITTNNISFNFTCGYKRTMQTSLKLPGNITQQTVYLSGANGTGSYPVTMAAYKNPSFTEPYENNEDVTVGSIIYVGIFVTGADGSQYVVRVESCVASPTDNRSDVNAFYLIKDGCVQGTVPTLVLDNSKALEASFSISAFQFQNQAYVNLFCDVRLCDKTTETCSGCGGAKSSKTASNEVKIGLALGGNLDFVDSAGKHTAASWALLAGIQLAIVFIKFF
ncbi:uromodulin-like [Rana temporaria]|uniref:uromodulin-like n=1 Tax=Rana temporaria TaxID=8407 RepID=UPI001AAD8DE7|nr:uromodulin-like [Rana temporaria]